MARKETKIGTIRETGQVKEVWDGENWISFRQAFEEGLLDPAEHGQRLDHHSGRGGIDSSLEYSINIALWQVDEFYVVTDDATGNGGVFDTEDDARAEFEMATEEQVNDFEDAEEDELGDVEEDGSEEEERG